MFFCVLVAVFNCLHNCWNSGWLWIYVIHVVVVAAVAVVVVIVIAVHGALCFWCLISHTLLYLPNVIVVIVTVLSGPSNNNNNWRLKCDGRCALCGKIRSGPELSKMTFSRLPAAACKWNWPKQRDRQTDRQIVGTAATVARTISQV